MASDYITKTIAVNYICMQSGYGRRVVERTLKRLQDEGKVNILEGPDGRTLLISRSQVEYVITYLKNAGQMDT